MAILITVYILIAFCVWALAAQYIAEEWWDDHETWTGDWSDDVLLTLLTFISLILATFWPVMLAIYILSLPTKYLISRKK